MATILTTVTPSTPTQPSMVMSDQCSAHFHSKESRALFDIIDRLRSHGIGEVVDLPEIIVCGDQSAGKSSVLEAISGHPFPTKDGLCTRFMTELILRREPVPKFKVEIIPGPERAVEESERLRKFSESIGSDMPLDGVIEEAKIAMGVSIVKRFSTDILRVEISGPNQVHLTMVDLPGLFRAGNSEQSVEDVKTVSDMVRRAMSRPRSIILAVVSASNEFNNQEITELARKLDPGRERTLGLITKPDKLDRGSESEKNYVRLARNLDVVLKLGWHVLRNQGSGKNTEETKETRDEVETAFFSYGVWRSVGPSHIGIVSLRKRLSNVLGDQILIHLPSLREEVASRIRECENTLERLGDPRETPEKQRRYLLGVSRRFSLLMTAGVEGNYGDAFFGDAKTDEGYSKRIRAVVQNTLRDFGKIMHNKGKLQIIIDDLTPSDSHGRNPKKVDRSAYIEEVTYLIGRNKGRELPGTFNPLIVSDLFKTQCRPWRNIVAETTSAIVEAVTNTAFAILRHVALGSTVGGISAILNQGIENQQLKLDRKVQELLAPHYEGHPITYNHYLIDIVQKAQSQRRARVIQDLMDSSIGSSHVKTRLNNTIRTGKDSGDLINISEVATIFKELEKTEADMEAQASGLAADYAEAYYKIALKRIIDEISDLGIEQQLIRHLPTLFSPEMVLDLTNDQVTALASEDEEAVTERSRCDDLLIALLKSMEDLKCLYSGRGETKQPIFSSTIVFDGSPVIPSSSRPEPAMPISRLSETLENAPYDEVPAPDVPAEVPAELAPTSEFDSQEEEAEIIFDWGDT